MDLNKVATILQTLQACNVRFNGDMNHVEVTSFKLYDGQILKYSTTDNATGFREDVIKYDGPPIREIRLQMTTRDGKTFVGGQVTQETYETDPQYFYQQPVLGDEKELKVVYSLNYICPYLFGDAVYVINDNRQLKCVAFKASNGTFRIAAERKQPNIDCSERFGVNDEEGIFIFKKNGRCMKVKILDFWTPWDPRDCEMFDRIISQPLKLGQYYHLRYLTITNDCQMPREIFEPIIDSTYIRFSYVEPPTTTPTPTPPPMSDLEIATFGLGSVAASILGGLAIVGIVVCVKCRERCICCCKKKVVVQAKATPVAKAPVPAPGRAKAPVPAKAPAPVPPPGPVKAPVPAKASSGKIEEKPKVNAEKVGDKKAVEKMDLTASRAKKKTNIPKNKATVYEQDSDGNIDENLQSENPLDFVPVMHLKGKKVFYDEDFDLQVPGVIRVSNAYVFVEKLGQGGFGAVYKYKTRDWGNREVAVKFLKTTDPIKLRNARKEFMLIRQIQQFIDGDLYVTEVIDYGKYETSIFMVMPFYYCCMENVRMNLTDYTMAQRINIGFQYLQGIVQLQNIKYAHLDIKPENYMQKEPKKNKVVLCDFGLVKRFDAKRSFCNGTMDYMSLPCHFTQKVSIVDDMQSWFIMFVELIHFTLPWDENEDLRREDPDVMAASMRMAEVKIASFANWQEDTPEDKLIKTLLGLIWEKKYGDSVDMTAVMVCLNKTQQTFQFRFDDPWWSKVGE
ncbi:unnamed protein product [Bursaphelenchus xylophilus]|uniref:(pine wood nematode) hypothetical protein n=1 Tax=Bursaphelenchus xylophilus TaxID=6326 RepID=A0A1I7S1B9_BURXY|nr:unnamed protein product [Bursaphelenchus xylophilus]CAG9080250.1 unnamed protein product [Bursaphelenchus xylophilus]